MGMNRRTSHKLVAFPDTEEMIEFPVTDITHFGEDVTVFPVRYDNTPHLALAWESSPTKVQMTLLDERDARRVHTALTAWLAWKEEV